MLKGSIVALITPFKNGKLDIETFKNLVQKHIEAKTNGLVLCGSTGEGSLLSKEERRLLFEIASKMVGKEMSLIVGCNHFHYDSLLELIDPSYETILVTPPPYVKPSQEGIIQFFTRLHNDTNANIILYNNPARCGVDMDVATIRTLFTLPRVMGLKDSNTNLERITELSCYSDRKSLLCGEDSMLLDYIARGGNGAISVVGNMVPELMTEFFSAHTLEHMQHLHEKIHEYIVILNQGGNPAAIKGLMSLVQECQNELRFPLTPLSVHTLEHMKGMLHDIEGHCCQQACHI